MSAPPPAARTARDRTLPRWLLALGVPLAALVLVGFFVFLRFPFDRFRETVSSQASRALGADVAIGRLDPSLGLAGPAFVARDVGIRWPDGRKARVSEARVRPAWSTAWLRGHTALHVDADSDLGAIAGALELGDTPAFDGRLEAIDLARLPVRELLRGTRLDGTLDLDGDVALSAGRPVGRLRFASREGSVAPQGMPVAIPYDVVTGELDFGADGSVAIETVTIEGPMISGRVAGGAGPSPSLLLAPLDLDVHLEVSDANLRPLLRNIGVPLRPDGSVSLKIRGNLANPVVR